MAMVGKDGKTRQKTMIEVTEVRGYSIGIGPVTIWAHGKAGWFEIRPAPMYERIYRKMAEGVKLYYFLTDIYESRKKQALSLDEVFQRVSVLCMPFENPLIQSYL